MDDFGKSFEHRLVVGGEPLEDCSSAGGRRVAPGVLEVLTPVVIELNSVSGSGGSKIELDVGALGVGTDDPVPLGVVTDIGVKVELNFGLGLPVVGGDDGNHPLSRGDGVGLGGDRYAGERLHIGANAWDLAAHVVGRGAT